MVTSRNPDSYIRECQFIKIHMGNYICQLQERCDQNRSLLFCFKKLLFPLFLVMKVMYSHCKKSGESGLQRAVCQNLYPKKNSHGLSPLHKSPKKKKKGNSDILDISGSGQEEENTVNSWNVCPLKSLCHSRSWGGRVVPAANLPFSRWPVLPWSHLWLPPPHARATEP